jgi:hypothetical protein
LASPPGEERFGEFWPDDIGILRQIYELTVIVSGFDTVTGGSSCASGPEVSSVAVGSALEGGLVFDQGSLGFIGGKIGWPLRQAGLRLSCRRGRLPLPGRRVAVLSLHQRGGRQGSAALLDQRMFQVRAQIAMHDRAGEALHKMGA